MRFARVAPLLCHVDVKMQGVNLFEGKMICFDELPGGITSKSKGIMLFIKSTRIIKEGIMNRQYRIKSK
jgi:hypothetical protein